MKERKKKEWKKERKNEISDVTWLKTRSTWMKLMVGKVTFRKSPICSKEQQCFISSLWSPSKTRAIRKRISNDPNPKTKSPKNTGFSYGQAKYLTRTYQKLWQQILAEKHWQIGLETKETCTRREFRIFPGEHANRGAFQTIVGKIGRFLAENRCLNTVFSVFLSFFANKLYLHCLHIRFIVFSEVQRLHQVHQHNKSFFFIHLGTIFFKTNCATS